ncbi:hypothetical protein CRUP_004848, partial [Coryphaenoides rupestris]
WSDKTELDLHNWAEGGNYGSPVNHKLCVTMSSATGKWSLDECSRLHGYVCKRRTVSVVETRREPHYVGGCPDNWLYFGHKCYLLHLPERPEEGKSWPDASSICSSFQGSLVAIEDPIQQGDSTSTSTTCTTCTCLSTTTPTTNTTTPTIRAESEPRGLRGEAALC